VPSGMTRFKVMPVIFGRGVATGPPERKG